MAISYEPAQRRAIALDYQLPFGKLKIGYRVYIKNVVLQNLL
jgi:hypothetical protein